jgi:hypothetical protein
MANGLQAHSGRPAHSALCVSRKTIYALPCGKLIGLVC